MLTTTPDESITTRLIWPHNEAATTSEAGTGIPVMDWHGRLRGSNGASADEVPVIICS
jgi:hypothetical protein